MNERIRELAEQAGCKVMDDGEWYIPSATGLEKIVYTKGLGLEKFAESIIKECRIALNPMLRDMVSRGQAYDLIKQHFGMKHIDLPNFKLTKEINNIQNDRERAKQTEQAWKKLNNE